MDFHFPIMASLSGGTNRPRKSQPFSLLFFIGFKMQFMYDEASWERYCLKYLILKTYTYYIIKLCKAHFYFEFRLADSLIPNLHPTKMLAWVRGGCVMKSFYAGRNYLLQTSEFNLIKSNFMQGGTIYFTLSRCNYYLLWTYKSAKCSSSIKCCCC